MIRIPSNATIIGEIRCDGATRVDARVEGDGNINGILLISKTCVWIGNIVADKVIIHGTVEGKVFARKKIEISSKAKVTGQLIAPEMHVEKGAIVNCIVDISPVRIPLGLIKPKPEERATSPIVDELTKRRQAIQRSA